MYEQTSPLSNFTKGPVATLAQPDGRLTATLSRLKENRYGQVTEIPLANEAAFLACLKERFNLVPDGQRKFPARGMGCQEPET